MHMSYWRFAAMIATSTLVMFGLMYLNTYALEHVLWSETRAWMALLMGASMAIIMLSYMLGMYHNGAINIGIFVASALVFTGSLWLVRSQSTIDQVEYMQAMVPHHSIAIMTSERAQIEDPRVRKLADEIIAAQRREIAEMKYLVARLTQEEDGNPTLMDPPSPEVVSASEALNSPDLTKTDPGTLESAEIDKLIAAGARCSFAYTAASPPIFAAGTGSDTGSPVGVIKIHGRLVQLSAVGLDSAQKLASGGSFEADGIRISVAPDANENVENKGDGFRRPADLLFELEQGLSVGYRGWLRCIS